jgi:ribonuclease P protein component
MNKDERIKKNSQFRFIYSRGKSYSNDKLVLYIFRNRKNINRIGLSVSKKVGNSVVRNRIKRLIREAYRINKTMYKNGYDFIFIARAGVKNAKFIDVEKSVIYLMKKGGLIKEGVNNEDNSNILH